MPKVSQKTSGRRREPPSSSESDSDVVPPKNSAGRKNGEKSRGAKTPQQNVIADSDEEGNTASETASAQRSTSTLEKQFTQLSMEDRDRLSNDIVRYLLAADNRKVPIKQADIRKHALREYSRSFGSVMKIAIDKMLNLFGIDVVEMDLGKQKAYILINSLDNKYDAPHQNWPPEDHAKMGLVMVILSVIFMKGNVLMEEDLYDLFNRLGIAVDQPDSTFGDVKHFVMTDLVRQGYLEVEREQGSDPPTHLFRWGPRAKAETSKRHAMDFICQVFGEDTPQRWAAQMHDIEQSQAAEKSTAKPERPSGSRNT